MQSFYQRLKNREGRVDALARTQAEFPSHLSLEATIRLGCFSTQR